MDFSGWPVYHWVGCLKEGISQYYVVLSNVCNEEVIFLAAAFMKDLELCFFGELSEMVICSINIADLPWFVQFIGTQN